MLTKNTLIFDIETIPDTEFGSRIWDLDGISDEERVKAMNTQHFHKAGNSSFLPHHFHRIIAISAGLRTATSFRVWSLGDERATEKELLERFFSGINKFDPVLVSWNGSGFDLPVVHYRSLFHSVSAPFYWEMGESDKNFRFNNFISRFHWRHIDLMDVLSGYQLRAAAPLTEISLLLGLPGKLGMDGSQVWDAYQSNRLTDIRNYCDVDVLNTYLIYLRFEMMRGNLTGEELQLEERRVKNFLKEDGAPHLLEFLERWDVLPENLE